VLPELIVQNKHRRMSFAEGGQTNKGSFNNVWFSNEAHFHLEGVVNKHNVRFRVSGNPRVIREKLHHAPRITERVNSGRYLSMLHNTFVPHLLAIGLPLQTQRSCRMKPGHIQHMFFWVFCTTSQTDFLIVSHVDRTDPRIVLI
jgi:hypothetical protein